MAGGSADPGLVVIEIAKGPQVPVPSGYWGVEGITGCGHRMVHSGFAVDDVAVRVGELKVDAEIGRDRQREGYRRRWRVSH